MSTIATSRASLARHVATVALAVGVTAACSMSAPDVEATDTTSSNTSGVDAGPPDDSVDAAPPDQSAVGTDGTSSTAATTTEATTTTAEPLTTTTTTTEPRTTTTTSPATTPQTSEPEAEPAPDSWTRGSEGPEVTAIQSRLAELGFYVPVVDGKYGSITQQGVLAFQKGAGLARDGVAGPQTLAALETAEPVGPREGGDHIEVDLARQLMFVTQGGETLIFNTSTGTTGWETPPGRFTITRQINGMRHAPLGQLWRPKYFNGGIAMHGSPNIPGYPASHGCTRLHNEAINYIWDAGLAPLGTQVWVY